MARLKEKGIVLSYFIAHTYYWGDIYLQNLGRERANRISPLETAAEKLGEIAVEKLILEGKCIFELHK